MLFDNSQIMGILQQRFPAIEPIVPLKLIGEGFSSLVVETASGYVVRIARQVDISYANEFVLLPKIAMHLAVNIPQPTLYHPRTPTADYEMMGYAKLDGRVLDETLIATLNLAKFVHQLAEFMWTIHNIPPHTILDNKSPHSDYQLHGQELYSATMPHITQSLTNREYDVLENWWAQFLANTTSVQWQVVHGDLWYGNLLVDEHGNLCGILDWEACRVGDAAVDFAPQYYLGEAFVHQLSMAYQKYGGVMDAEFRGRVTNYRVIREFEGLHYALKYADAEEYQDAIAKIRQLFSTGYPMS